MTTPELQFIVEGDDAKAAASELAELVRDSFDIEVTPLVIQEGAPGPAKKLDPNLIVAVTGAVSAAAALMVAVPTAVLKVMDIVERLKKKKRVDKFKEGVDAISTRYKSTRISIRRPDGATVLIETVESNDLMDLASGDER